MNEEKKEATVYSEHLFLWPFSISGKNGSRSASEDYLRALDKQGCWKRLEKTCDPPPIVRYGVWEYLSNEARGVFPSLSLTDRDADGICSILQRDVPEGSTYTICHSERQKDESWVLDTWNLRLTGIEMHVYYPGIGILLLRTVNENNNKLSDIKKIADYGRRVRHPFLPQDETGGAADTLKLTLGNQVYEFRLLEQAKRAVSEQTHDASEPKALDFSILVDPGTGKGKIVPVADDRMFEMELIYSDYLSNQVTNQNFPWRENEAFTQMLYSLIFCDPGSPTCQDKEMRRSLLHQTIDPRWADEGTLYAASEYSFLCLTGESDYCKNVLGQNFLNQYLYMVSLTLTQRTGLMSFAERAGKLARQKRRLNHHLNKLSKAYSSFQMQLMISRYSDQDQGIELYEKLQKQLRVEQYRDKIQQQLSGAFEQATLAAQNRQNLIIGVVGFVLALLQIFLAA